MDIRRHLIGGLLAGAVLAPAMVQADAPAPKWYDKLTLGGYAAGDYEFWLNHPASTAGVPGRAFDTVANAFDYTGEMTLAYADTASGTSANIDLLYGALGNVIAGYGNGPSIGQAYLSQAWGPLTLDLGKFATPVGYETWNVTANANFSRSITYNLEPLFSLGAKLDYAGPGGFGANLWVDNGTNVDPYASGITDNGKGLGVALSFSGVKNLALNAQFYHDDSTLIAANQSQDWIDVNAAYTLSDSLSLAAEYLYWTVISGNTGVLSTKIHSAALYATYVTPVKNLTVSGRVEHENTPDTGLGNNKTADSYTLTAKYAMGPVTDILEYRSDATSNYSFTTSNGTATQTDQTVTVAATYGF
jgi:hypothetical protein